MKALSFLARGIRGHGAVLLLPLVGLVIQAPVAAQTGAAERPPVYKEDHPRDLPIADQTAARAMLRTGVVTDPRLFDAVYQWRCSQFTWHGKVNEAADLRQRLKADLRSAERAAKPDAHDRLTGLLLKSLAAIAKGADYHPTARLNALLLLGDLNARTGSGASAKYVPHPDALTHLLAAADRAASPVNGVDDALRTAALHSLVRHGKDCGAESAARPTILKAALAIASNSEIPTGREKEVHAWIQRRAVNVVEATLRTGLSDLDKQASSLLQAMIGDRGLPLKVRLDASRAFGRTHQNRPDDTLADTQLAQSLGALTIDLLNSEVVRPGRGGITLRSDLSREVLAQGLGKISLALRTVEAPQPEKGGATESKDPVAVQYLRNQLALVRKFVGDYEVNNVVTAQRSTLLANDLNAWLDAQTVAQAADRKPDAMDEQP